MACIPDGVMRHVALRVRPKTWPNYTKGWCAVLLTARVGLLFHFRKGRSAFFDGDMAVDGHVRVVQCARVGPCDA